MAILISQYTSETEYYQRQKGTLHIGKGTDSSGRHNPNCIGTQLQSFKIAEAETDRTEKTDNFKIRDFNIISANNRASRPPKKSYEQQDSNNICPNWQLYNSWRFRHSSLSN